MTGPHAFPDARAILEAADRAVCLERPAGDASTRSSPPLDLPAAEALQAEVVALRRARGERPIGFKIGFTNRSIWPLYGVYHPIWAPVYDMTVTFLQGTDGQLALARFVQPRLEPEIVFGLRESPASSDPGAVFACVDWVAHGFEIVQSAWPDWKFTAAEAVAVQSLHGALLVGPRRPRASVLPAPEALAGFRLTLFRDGQAVARGEGRQVLDSPLHALCHLVRELDRRGQRVPAGAIVTTGTITDAQPLAPGQRWHTDLAGLDLPGLTLTTGP